MRQQCWHSKIRHRGQARVYRIEFCTVDILIIQLAFQLRYSFKPKGIRNNHDDPFLRRTDKCPIKTALPATRFNVSRIKHCGPSCHRRGEKFIDVSVVHFVSDTFQKIRKVNGNPVVALNEMPVRCIHRIIGGDVLFFGGR